MHLLLNKAKLDHSQRQNQQHQDNRLGGRSANISATKSVLEHFEHQGICRPTRCALGCCVDDPEGFKEGIDRVNDQQEECCWRDQREYRRDLQ